MKHKLLFFFTALCVSFLSLFKICQAENPIITDIYTADPSARVDKDGRLYLYPSHDIEPNRGCDLMDQYHVYSTSDMVNWTDHGEILRASQVPWGRAEGGFMWAPDCIYKDGTYYYYFPHPSGDDWGSTWKTGIATSTSPAGGFTVQGYIPGLDPLIDPNVFIDDDGQAYFYHGGGGICKGGKLKDNMMEIDGSMQNMQGLVDFHEAAWVFKRNGIYYLTYADNHSDSTGDNRMCYATSTNPLGPWTYRGIIMDPTDSFCAHGSIVEYKGQWYVFYFNSSISKNDWLRSTCVDKLNFNPDGTIQKVIQTKTSVAAVTGNYPDFVVTDITWTPQNPSLGNGVTFRAVVKNQGTAPGAPGTVAFKVDGTQAAVSASSTASLAPGATVTLTANSTWSATGGSHKIVAAADNNNITVEVDNYNNFYHETMNIDIGPAPDLIVTDISWNPEIPSAGNDVTFSATVKNQGTAPGAAGTVAFKINGNQIAATLNSTSPLAAGTTAVYTANGTWRAVSGNYSLTAVVDNNNITAEASEANNSSSKGLTVLAGPTPDLVVTDISWNPANPAPGNAVTFSATIKNRGSGATPAGVIHGVAFQIDGGGTSLWSDTYTSSIPAGASVTLTVNGGTAGSVWNAVSGTHSILAWVDDVNRIPNEIDETNNQYTKNLTIGSSDGRPDLVVTDISWTPGNPGAGTAVTFSAVIKNQGGAATPEGVIHGVAFQIDNGQTAFWSDNYTSSIPAGASVTVTVNGGVSGPAWTAVNGNHTVLAWVDDVNRITNESDENNNTYTESIMIGTTGGDPAGDMIGKVYAGYQGWFNAYGDGSPVERWRHWSAGTYQSNTGVPAPGNITFELYPDVSEYTELYPTNLGNLGNGEPAELFSSYSEQTVNKHFEWMQTYGIDGAALQRFGGELADPVFKTNRDSIASKVKSAAETYGRKFYIMYDISGMGSNFDTILKNDWANTITGTLNLTASSAYARQDGKPVICIWGIGFTDRPGDPSQSLGLINWFKSQGCYVTGGVPTHWRTGNDDSKAGFENVYKALNMISPWSVGRFKGLSGADGFKSNQLEPDISYCNLNGIAYQPVMFPGFAWSNWNNGPKNDFPRLHGDFMWRQAYNIKSLGISSGYIAMFDEYDEGTAIAKAAENSTQIPNNQYFLTLDADGVACSSDFYLRLAGDITRMFKGLIPLTENHPTSHR